MINKRIGPYQILKKLGSGGMGEVWLAEDTRLERQVALKFLPLQATQSEEEKARLVQEAKAAARLNHPNIAQVYEIGNDAGIPYIVMEYVAGGSLRDRLESARGRPLSLDDVLSWIKQAAEGLGEAHRQGITHRDIKPDNLMLTLTGQLKITDFGLAKLDNVTRLTVSGAVLGTINYMSPEQVLGKDIDHRTDLFSLGATLFELLTGHKAFHGRDANATYFSILNDEVNPLSRYRSDITGDLPLLLQKLLQKDPELRAQSSVEVAGDLRRMLAGVPRERGRVRPIRSLLRKIHQVHSDTWLTLGIGSLALGLLLTPEVRLFTNAVHLYSYRGTGYLPELIWSGLGVGGSTDLQERLDRLKASRDVDAYVASALIRIDSFYRPAAGTPAAVEREVEGALKLSPTDASLYGLKAQCRQAFRGLTDSIAYASALTARRLDPENGAYAFLAFVPAQLWGDSTQAESYLREVVSAPRFSLGWSDYYSCVYRCLNTLGLLKPDWRQRYLPEPRISLYATAVRSFLGRDFYIWELADARRMEVRYHSSNITDTNERIERSQLVEAVGYRIFSDQTLPTFMAAASGGAIIRTSHDEQLALTTEEDPARYGILSKGSMVSVATQLLIRSQSQRLSAQQNLAEFSIVWLGLGAFTFVVLLWTALNLLLFRGLKKSPIEGRKKLIQRDVPHFLLISYSAGVVGIFLLFTPSAEDGSILVLVPTCFLIVAVILIHLLSRALQSVPFRWQLPFWGLVMVWVGPSLVMYPWGIADWMGLGIVPLLVLLLLFGVGALILWRRYRVDLAAGLPWIWRKVLLISSAVLLIATLSLWFQSVSIEQELADAMWTPNPTIVRY